MGTLQRFSRFSRFSRSGRRLVAGAVLVSFCLAPAVALSQSAPEVPQASAPGKGGGLETVASCLNTNGRLLVEMLVDESGSLQQTDPENLRVQALRAALGSIQSLTRTTVNGKQVEVEVQVSSFAADFRTETDFVPLTTDSVGSLLDTAQGFETRNNGLQTDYVYALRGANESLTNRAAALTASGGKVCKAIFWFTDGAYDVADSAMNAKDYAPGLGGSDVQRTGEQLLCEGNTGVADQLRQSGVVNVAVALTGSGFNQSALSLLSGIVSGSPSCGSFPDADRFGVLLDVKNADQLTSAALAAISGTTGQVRPPVEVCQSQLCDRKIEFSVPPGVGSFYVLTTAPAAGIERWLQAPGTQPTKIDPGSTSVKVGSASVAPTVISPTSLLLDVALDAGDPDTGTWSLTFVDPAGGGEGALASAEVFLIGALRPALPQDASFTQGDSSQIEIQVTDANGAPVRGAAAATTKLLVVITDPVSQATTRPTVSGPDASGVYRFSHQTPTSSKAAALNVSMALAVTVENGLTLRPVVVEKAVPVTVPSTTPSVRTTELALGSVEGAATARGSVQIDGPERGTGTVCLDDWQARALPKGINELELDTTKRCVTVAQGATASLPVALKSTKGGSGTADGLVELTLKSADGSEEVTRAIPVSFEMRLKPNESVRWLTDVLLTALGVLIPLAIYWLLLRVIDKFRGLEWLQWSEVPVTVTPQRVERANSAASDVFAGGFSPAQQFTFAPQDWNFVGGDSRRHLDLGSLRISVVSHFFGVPAAVARSGAQQIVSTHGAPRSRALTRLFGSKPHTVTALPFDLTDNWVFVVDAISFDEPAADPNSMFLPAIKVELDPEVWPPFIMAGRVFGLVDNHHGWSDREATMAGEVNSDLLRLVEPLVKTAWAVEYKARTEAAERGTSDESTMADLGAGTAGNTAMPWEIPPTNSFGQDPTTPPKAPWE